MLHLYYGADEFRLRESFLELRASLDTDGLLPTNTTTLTARGLAPGVLLQHVTTLPFLASARVVVVEGLVGSVGGARNALASWQTLLDVLPALPPTNHLVLLEPFADRDAGAAFSRSAFARALRGLSEADVREFRVLRSTGRDNEVAAWARSRAAGRAIAIEPAAIEALVGHVGSDLRVIASELEKLAQYARGRAITSEDVVALTPEAAESSIFNLVDAVVEGRGERALVMLRGMLEQGSEEPMRVQAMIARQLRNLVRAGELLDAGAPASAIADATGVTGDFPLRKLTSQARAMGTRTAEDGLRAVEASDHAFKTGQLDPVLALELLVMRLAELVGAPTRASRARRA